MDHYNILRINLIVFSVVLFLGASGLIAVSIYSARRHDVRGSCASDDFVIDIGADTSIISVEKYEKNLWLLNLGQSIIMADLCRNKVIKRILVETADIRK